MVQVIIILGFLFLSAAPLQAKNDCLENWSQTQKMIDDLRVEVTCSNANSLKTCHQFFFGEDRTSSKKTYDIIHNPRCKKKTQIFLPLSTTPPVYKKVQNILSSENFPKRHFVNSAEDFYHHMDLHKKRVVDLGLAAYDKFPHFFPDISRGTLKNILEHHDNAKVTPSSLASNGEPFYKVLYEKGYGKNIDRKWVDELNRVDDNFMEEAYKKAGLQEFSSMNDQMRSKVRRTKEVVSQVEKIADLTDRVHSEVSPEEFGRRMYSITSEDKNSKYGKLIHYLQNNYQTITKNHKYTPLSDTERAKLMTRLRAAELITVLKNGNDKKLSRNALKSLATSTLKNSDTFVSKLMSSKLLLRFLTAIDGVSLFFGGMYKIGCGELGKHSWTKVDGVCKPTPGLTPPMINFLKGTNNTQRQDLKYAKHQCNMLQKTHKMQEIQRFNDVKCENGRATLITKDNKTKLTMHRNGKSLSEIDIEQFSHRRFRRQMNPTAKTSIKLNADFQSKEVCFDRYQNFHQGECFSSEERNQMSMGQKNKLQNLMEKLQTNSFYIFKTLKSCKNSIPAN